MILAWGDFSPSVVTVVSDASSPFGVAEIVSSGVDSGIVTSGTIQFQDPEYATKVGMSATGTGDDHIRIWAGSTFDNRDSAPFRVTQGGALTATDATISGTMIAGDIHIPDQNTTANSFHTDSDGNSWWGCTEADFNDDNDNATAYVLATGEAKFQNITVAGGTVAGFTADKTDGLYIGSGESRIQLQPGTGIWCGATAIGDAPFNVTNAGALTAKSGEIAGWEISSTHIRKGANGTEIHLNSQINALYIVQNYGEVAEREYVRVGALNNVKQLIEEGTSSSVGENFLTDNTQSWSDDRFKGYTLIDSGLNEFEISTSSSDTLTVAGTPASGAYVIKAITFGFSAWSNSGGLLFIIDGTRDMAKIAGWDISTTTLANGTDIVLDADNKQISINDTTYGNEGIQLDYNGGTPRAYIGDGSNEYFKFDGTNISWNTPNTSLSTAGKLITTSAEIAGWDIVSGYIYSLASGTPTSTPSDGLVLASGDQGVTVYENNQKRVELGYLSSGVYGLKGYDDNGSTVMFELSDTQKVIAGWTISSTTLANGTDIVLDADNKQISINSATWTNAGIQLDYNGGTPRAYIGDGSNQYFQYDGTDISWNASNTSLSTAGKLTTTSAEIGGWNVDATSIYTGTEDHSGYTANSGDLTIYSDGSDASIHANNFYINTSGEIIAKGGTIAGWILAATTLSSSNITLDQGNDKITVNTLTIDGANNRIRSDNYASGITGSGFTLEPDLLEVGNIRARGMIRTAVFQKDVVSAVGGNLAVLPADVLASDMSADDGTVLTKITENGDTRITEDGDTKVTEGVYVLGTNGEETFAVGDLLRIKDGTDDEWLEVGVVNSPSEYYVFRDQADVYDGVNNNPVWKEGASVVNFKQSGDGAVYMTASETNAPYLSVFTHAGSPWGSLTTRLRIGNLNGFLGYTSDLYGIAIGETNKYLKYDPTNGLRIKGTITISNPAGVRSDINVSDGADVTKTIIDGGLVTTGQIQSTDYVSGSAGMMIDLNANSIEVNEADGLVVNSDGGISIAAGGDITLAGDDSDAGTLICDGSSNDIIYGANASGYSVGFYPATSGYGLFGIGFDFYNGVEKAFDTVWIVADDEIIINAYDNSNDGGILRLDNNSAELSYDENSSQVGSFRCTNTGAAFIYADSTIRLSCLSSEVVINEPGSDVDFRVEANGDTNALFVRGSDGNVGIGENSPSYKLAIQDDTGGAGWVAYFFNDGNNSNRWGLAVQAGADDGSGTTHYLTGFDGDGTQVGQIQNSGGNFSLFDVSDEILKKEIRDTEIDCLYNLKQVKVRDYKWRKIKDDVPFTQGFIAQELQEWFPNAVSMGQDCLLSVSPTIMVPYIARSIQQVDDKVIILENKVKALEQEIQTLKAA